MNPDAGLDDLMRTAARVNDAVAQVRGQGEAAGGRVRVEVTGDGAISNLNLDDQVRAMPAHELGRTIRDAQRAAIADATQRAHDIQSQITENSYVTTVLNQLGSAEAPRPQAPTSPNVGRRQRASGGMTDQELDAWQESFNSDPLGRRRER